MDRLNYKTLKTQNYSGYLLPDAPERMLQFGEGNFLRAFVDHFVDVMNERCGFDTKVAVIQPTGRSNRMRDNINEQDGLYTLLLRGNENGTKVDESRVISCISRCINPVREYDLYMECAKNPDLRFIVSNTTEAGIVYDPACQFSDAPAASFPGKLTQFLYARYQTFGTEKGKGFVIFPCELIDDNGTALKKCVLQYAEQWKLSASFIRWVEEENLFCSTLVDRIVTGYPASEADMLCEKFGYQDRAMDAGEVFASWVIEGPQDLKKELPFEQAGLPVLITDDHKPYKQRKVRILNGAHTSMVLGAYLAGQDIVRDCMKDAVIRGFMNRAIYEEIIPTLTLPKEELEAFAKAVTDRFSNPFIDHALLAISLNSTSKWRARVLPSLEAYAARSEALPVCLTASLAFYIAFYRGVRMEENGLIGVRKSDKKNEYVISDDRIVLEFYFAHRCDEAEALVQAVLSNTAFWGKDLTLLDGLCEAVTENLKLVEAEGAYALMEYAVFGV